MTIASVIADLEQARAQRQDEIDAIDAALRELRMIRSGTEGPHQQPVNISQAKDTAPETSAASSLPARAVPGPRPRHGGAANAIPPDVKAKVVAYAREHGTAAAVKKYGYGQSSIDRWRRLAGEHRVSGRKKSSSGAPVGVVSPTTPRKQRVEAGAPLEQPIDTTDRARDAAIASAGLADDDERPDPNERFRAAPHVAKPKVGTSLTPALRIKILDYALTHTVQETANQFGVSQQHIYDWRASRAQIEAEVAKTTREKETS
jgi:transposase-like protein